MRNIEPKEGELLMFHHNRAASILLTFPAIFFFMFFGIYFSIWVTFDAKDYPVIIKLFSSFEVSKTEVVVCTFGFGYVTFLCIGFALNNWKKYDVYYFNDYLLVSCEADEWKYRFEELEYFALNKNKLIFSVKENKEFNGYSSKSKKFLGDKFRLDKSYEYQNKELVSFLNDKIKMATM